MRVNLYMFTLLLLLNDGSSDLKTEKANSEDDTDDLFVPTHEWQVVKKGQRIPKGLHIRVNLQTGLTEAKLLDESKAGSKAVVEVPDINNGAQYSNTQDAPNSKYSEAELKEALKNIRDETASKASGKKFRSYEELKRDLDFLNVTPKTDAEIIRDLVSKYKKIVNADTKPELKILTILTDLEFLVHQYDNANEFVKLDGFREVIFRNLNSSSYEIKQEALKLFGSAVQNNAKVQIHALETGSINILLRIFVVDPDYGVKNRVLYALSSFVRRFPLAQLKLVEGAGLNVFVSELRKMKNIKLQLKIITLIHDLLLEHRDAAEEYHINNESKKLQQYDKINLKAKLNEFSWCNIVNDLLALIVEIDINDHDSVEKCLNAISSSMDTCDLKTAKGLENTVLTLKRFYTNLILAEGNEEDSAANYYQHLLILCRQITEYLSYHYKTEL